MSEHEHREAATYDDANGSECQTCGGQIPVEREHCPDCGTRSSLVGEPECTCTDADDPNDHHKDCPMWGRAAT